MDDAHHRAHLYVMLAAEILANTVFQRACLADVDQRAARIVKAVNARAVGQVLKFLFKRIVHGTIIP
ncbi:hypothetical protein SDC9_190543 [bioreactor metagenome]|uniref:Uncharacterized protein n=1 Tax=bioreactor metagenome TaxID=1076179 RepID=A0A645I3J6_9ZZZZ